MKSWNPGDSRVEKYMSNVMEAIKRHLKWPSEQFTDIYNQAYEAVWKAITDKDNIVQPEDKTEYWLAQFHGELHDGFHAYRKENNLDVEFKIDGIIFNKIVSKAKVKIWKRLDVDPNMLATREAQANSCQSPVLYCKPKVKKG